MHTGTDIYCDSAQHMSVSDQLAATDLRGLHVVIVPSWWPSPEQPMSGIFFADYVRAFAKAGAKVGVIFPDLVGLRFLFKAGSKNVVPQLSEERVDDSPVIRVRALHTALGMPRLQMARFRSFLRRGLVYYCQKYGTPDLLQAMCAIPAGWACTTLEDSIASRVVVTEHTGPFALAMRPSSAESFVRDALRSAAHIVAVSNVLRDEMRQVGINREIAVIGNPVSEVFAATASPPINTQSQQGVYRGLFVGRMTQGKGVRELAYAAILLHEKRVAEIEWHFAGDGPLADEIRHRLEKLGERAVFHGLCNREKIAQLLRESHFLALPSYSENCPMAICEALSVGRPVVTSDAPGCRALIESGDGLTSPVGVAEKIAVAIEMLLGDYARWDWQDISGRAAKRFAGAGIAQAYAGIYKSVAKR